MMAKLKDKVVEKLYEFYPENYRIDPEEVAKVIIPIIKKEVELAAYKKGLVERAVKAERERIKRELEEEFGCLTMVHNKRWQAYFKAKGVQIKIRSG